MTELKTAAEIRKMIEDKRSAVRSGIDLTKVCEKLNKQFIFDEIQIKLEDNGYTVRPQYGLGFGSTPPRIGLVIYWDSNDLPDGGADEKD